MDIFCLSFVGSDWQYSLIAMSVSGRQPVSSDLILDVFMISPGPRGTGRHRGEMWQGQCSENTL